MYKTALQPMSSRAGAIIVSSMAKINAPVGRLSAARGTIMDTEPKQDMAEQAINSNPTIIGISFLGCNRLDSMSIPPILVRW